MKVMNDSAPSFIRRPGAVTLARVIVNPIGFTALGLASPTPLSTRTKFTPNSHQIY